MLNVCFAGNISQAGGTVKEKLQYGGEFLDSYHNMWEDLTNKTTFLKAPYSNRRRPPY
jgi:hypothetical protein